jgi:hypothetical protein
MPAAIEPPVLGVPPSESAAEEELQFPPVTRDHILHCSYDYWFPKCVLPVVVFYHGAG